MIDLTKDKMQTDELNSDTLQPNDLSDLDEVAIKEKTKTSNLFILITILTFTIIAIIAFFIAIIVYVITNNISNIDAPNITIKPILKILVPFAGTIVTITAIADITKNLLNPLKQINWMSCMTRIILGGALISNGFGILLHR